MFANGTEGLGILSGQIATKPWRATHRTQPINHPLTLNVGPMLQNVDSKAFHWMLLPHLPFTLNPRPPNSQNLDPGQIESRAVGSLPISSSSFLRAAISSSFASGLFGFGCANRSTLSLEENHFWGFRQPRQNWEASP